MATKRRKIPRYGTVEINGSTYYKTYVENLDGKRTILYGKTREELYDKELDALERIDSATFRRKSPTVAEYCEKWLLMQSAHVRTTTLTDYTCPTVINLAELDICKYAPSPIVSTKSLDLRIISP